MLHQRVIRTAPIITTKKVINVNSTTVKFDTKNKTDDELSCKEDKGKDYYFLPGVVIRNKKGR